MEQNRNEWVMHVWGKKRDALELTDVEKFHIDMLKKYQDQQKRFDKILINIAMDDFEDDSLFYFLKENISKVIVNPNVEFKCCQNDSKLGEYVTFRPYVFDRIGENVNVFYSHFKGYRSYFICKRESYPMRVTDMCEMFWSYIMYAYSMNFDDVQEKLGSGKNIYCWFILNKTLDEVAKENSYYTKYLADIDTIDPELKNCMDGESRKHSPGSFVWYNLKAIGESLKDKPLVTSIKYDLMGDGHNCTHFCELYLMNFLKTDDCYGLNDYKKEWDELNKTTTYATVYTSKKVGREYMDEFNKYLIENGLI